MTVRNVISRRRLLGASFVGAGALVAGCGGDEPTATPTDEPTSGGSTPTDDPTEAILSVAGISGATVDYSVLFATIEPAAGESVPLQFGLLDDQRSFLEDADVEVYLVRDSDKALVAGPVQPTFYKGPFERGIYVFEADLEQAGIHDLVVATADGAHAGLAAFPVLQEGGGTGVVAGQPAPAVDTPTVDDPKGLQELCTREPDCSMHDVSLADALEEGRPVVLSLATPKYCTSATCGPVVDIIEEAKASIGRDDIAWIHVEVFSDAGNTPTDTVIEFGIGAEPWTYLIGSDGVVVERLGGPVVPDLLRAAVEKL